MFSDYEFSVKDRLMRYVQIDTQSDPNSKSNPSSEKQKTLGRMLVQELKELGISDAELDEYGYVYATLPSNTTKEVPVICFCAHVDTAPDCSGTGVIPILHERYDGSPIVLPDDPTQIITTDEHPYLKEKIGEDIITASGTTLLGADDKAGVAVIMDMVNFFVKHQELRHGKIRILFTPDEEIGKGVNNLDLKKLNASYAYTLDGGERGSLEDENFSADGATIIFHGISAHPGDAKDKMINAIKMASYFVELLPRDELSPESTEDRYGFVHPIQIEGIAEKVKMKFIIRDFFTHKLEAYENFLKDRLEDVLRRFPGSKIEIDIQEQYRNMKEVLDQHPQVTEYAKRAIERAGIAVRTKGIRGGTDGARLSFMGLPCPNIFTGEMALHGKHEYVSVQDMQKSVETIVNLAMIWEEQT